jgi:hypothetical protein
MLFERRAQQSAESAAVKEVEASRRGEAQGEEVAVEGWVHCIEVSPRA